VVGNDYALELFQGPLLAPIRVTGLAGATSAISDAVEGVYNNAAAPAVRESFSLSWFEFEPSIGIALPGAYAHTDFNNRGERGLAQNSARGLNRSIETTDNFLYLQAGAWAQFGALGISMTADLLNYDVAPQQADRPQVGLWLARAHTVGAYSFLGNQVCIGAGARVVGVRIDVGDLSGPGFSMFGAAPELGVIVKPDDVPWRIGATARAAVEAGTLGGGSIGASEETKQNRNCRTARCAGGFVLPDRITEPWELEFGVAYQLGPRPLNPAWINPVDEEKELDDRILRARAERAALQRAEIATLPATTPQEIAARDLRLARITAEEEAAREVEEAEVRDARLRLREERKARYLNWPRERILLLGSMLLTGPSENAVALEGFINQEHELVGQTISVSPRFAIESEPVANWIKFRTGIYSEPSRFVDGTRRQHFTFGGDVRLFDWDVFGILPSTQTWRISAFFDVAPRYENFGFGIGAWH